MSSDEDENDASMKANTQRHHDASEADGLSLFGGGDIDEIEDTALQDMEMEAPTMLVCCLRSALFWVVHKTQVLQLQKALPR